MNLKEICLAVAGSFLLVVMLLVGPPGRSASTQTSKDPNTNSIIWANSSLEFFSISNREWIHFGSGSCLIRLTDDEWKILTNAYHKNITTNKIVFYK